MEKILLIDGNSLVYKSFYATNFLKNKPQKEDEENIKPPIMTNALHTFALTIIKIAETFNGEKICVAFDSKEKKTFRHEYDFYKAQRSKTPDELITQFSLIREFLDLYGITWIENPSYEADDLIGIIANYAQNKNFDVKILTSDKDLLQLVDQNISVFLSKKGVSELEEYNNSNFQEKFFGLSPLQIVDFKGIAGDKSDNIKGIDGIGEKTAIKLLKEYNNLENIYNNLYELSSSIQEKFKKNYSIGMQSKKLSKIITEDNNLNINLQMFDVKKIESEKMKLFLDKYKLKKVKNKINFI